MSDGNRKAALTIALVMGSSGALLLIVTDASHDAGARSSAGAVAYGLPLAAAPFVALLAGSWSRVRVNVEPAGLSRSRRILSLAPMLMVLGAIVGSAVLLGSGDVVFGLGTLAAGSVAFASFLREQTAARPPTASGRHEERDEYDLRRTPGIAGLGAMASLYGLVVGASTESLMQGVLWASFPLAITLLGIYGAAAPYLAFRGTPSAIVFLCAAPATLVSSVASDNPAGALIAFNGAALATTLVVTRKLERDRRAAQGSRHLQQTPLPFREASDDDDHAGEMELAEPDLREAVTRNDQSPTYIWHLAKFLDANDRRNEALELVAVARRIKDDAARTESLAELADMGLASN